MNINEHLAKQIVRDRVTVRTASRRPAHRRTARMLRRLAERVEGDT